MEAYDAAVLSYALATAATKIKPGLLGLAPPSMLGSRIPCDSDSLTPPSRLEAAFHHHHHQQESAEDGRTYLYQLLCTVDQHISNKIPVQLAQLMEVCSTRQAQVDQQIMAHLECLQQELRQICKAHPGSAGQMHLSMEDDEDTSRGVSLKTDSVCRSLGELLKQFGLVSGASALKKCFAS